MPYNLPPPWDPGFAIPGNVRDEGLERRAFVTKQMPRGTYYMSKVGTGGYAVPDYVMKEGYGQGAYTSKWMPPGSITTPPVPTYLNDRPKVAGEQALASGGRQVTIVRNYGKPSPGQVQAMSGAGSGVLEEVLPWAAAAGLAYFLLRKKGRR